MPIPRTDSRYLRRQFVWIRHTEDGRRRRHSATALIPAAVVSDRLAKATGDGEVMKMTNPSMTGMQTRGG